MRVSALMTLLFLAEPAVWAAPLAPLSPTEIQPRPAQAVVSAVKSPIKLTLTVYKTILKLHGDFKTETDIEKFKKENPPKNGEYDWTLSVLPKYDRRVPIKVGERLWIKIAMTNVGKKPV